MARPSDERLAALYGTLRELAYRRLGAGGQRKLQVDPTELVHEAFIKLQESAALGGMEREDFLPLAARVLRQVLVDLARRERASKRGGDRDRVTLTSQLAQQVEGRDGEVDLVELDEALARLERLYPRQARIVELRFFAGLSIDETARALDVSSRTIDGDWRMARAWLKRELEG